MPHNADNRKTSMFSKLQAQLGLKGLVLNYETRLGGEGRGRDGKTQERASNACVNFFRVWVKSVTNSTLFCRESELCCNCSLFGMILMAFNEVNLNFTLKRGQKSIYDINVASIVVWWSYFAHSCVQYTYAVLSQIHFCLNLRTYFG